jgi:hypothetical protein
MAEQPPLNRFYVASYAANDRDFPIVAIRLDPRVAGYRVPEDLSPHPDSKRYPNHVFTGSQPSNGDERVTHIYEILPAPWVPFTRYDDDLGPIQGRRRSVKNEGQVAILAADKRVTYEAREGSAIVYTEIEETWSISTDDDGNSLFPVRDRDFYDPSRGPVQERRQLFVPTGEEAGSLENVNGVITQTSYEPYNEFLSVKIVQTYSVDGPQLIGKATDNDGQLVTVTTQRKGADGYIPPNPTATRTVEVSREDAESLVERIVDTPEVFTAKTFSLERPDPIPQKFRVAVPLQSEQTIVEGQAELPILSEGEISRTEEQRNKFLKRTTATSRDQTVLPKTLAQKATNNERQEVTITETLQLGDTNEVPTATKTVESEALGDGNFVIRKTEVPEVFDAKTLQKTRDDLTPQKFRGAQESSTVEVNIAGVATTPILASGEFAKSEQQINKFVKRVSTTSRNISAATTLLESVLTPQGQLALRTLRLASGDQSIQPDAKLIDGSVEALGDGRTVKTEVRVNTVFDEKQESKQKPDIIPPEFRASLQDLTTAEVKSGTDAIVGQLAEDEVSKTVQRITEHKIRETKTVRAQGPYPQLSEELIDSDGIKVSRTRTVVSGAQSVTPTATVSGQVQALGDGYTLKVQDTKSKVFEGKIFSQEKPDNIPVEFRAEKPATTEEFSEAGNAATVSLSGNEIAKSEQQVTEFVKRVRTTTRELIGDVTLDGEQIDEDGVKVFVKRTLADGQQSITPSATVRGQVENIGDGKTIKTELTRDEIFEGQTFSIEKPEVIPLAFRAEKPAEVDEKTVSGDVEKPLLQGDEISKSEQQITKFLKRIRTTTRENVDTVELKDEQINQFGQKVDITRTLKKSAQSIDPSATVSGTVEALGDGYTLRTEEKVPAIFPNKTNSIERPDPAPQKFRVDLPTTTTQESVDGELDDNLSLGDDELSKTEQQQTEFVKRVSTTKRDEAVDGELIGKRTGTWGEETITETYNENGEIEVGHKILSNQKTPLGGGKFLGEKVQVVSPLALTETKKDAETGVVTTTTKTLVPADASLPSVGENEIAEITPIDAYNSIQIITSVNSVPAPEIFESSIDVAYPDVLESIGIEWDVQTGGGAGSSGISSISAIIQNDLGWNSSANATASAQVVGAVYTQIRRGHRGAVRARVTRTYSLNPPTTIPAVTLFNPSYGTVTIKGQGLRITQTSEVGGFGDAQSGSSSSFSRTQNNFVDSVQIGPFCHNSPLLQNAIAPNGASVQFSASGGTVPAGAYPATFAQATATASSALFLPSSSPLGSALTSGYSHIASVRVEKWRFGIWIQEVYEAFHP